MKKIIIFLLLATLSGCGFVFQDFDQTQSLGLAYGMSREEVAAKLGQPRKTGQAAIDGKNYEIWEYPDNTRKPEKINSLGTAYLKLFFLEGKLVQRNKDKVYGQPDYDYLQSLDPQRGVKPAKPVNPEKTADPQVTPAPPQENLK
jgi:hypothetical protein